MLSMYQATIIINIKGETKGFFNRKKLIKASLAPGIGYNIKIKAETRKEFEEKAKEIGEYYVDDWKNQLAEHLKNGNGLVLSGIDVERDTYIWTPCFITFHEIDFEIRDIKKLYDFKNKNVQHCMKHLTPEEFKKEFGFLIKTP